MHGTKMFYRAGLRLAYEEIGPEAPPAGRVLPVVMLHGMGCNRGLMKGCLEPSFERRVQTAFGTAYRRVYVDLPGMGDSNAPLALAGTDAVVEALAAFVRSVVGARPFALAGQSYGGYLARALAAEFAGQTAGLLLLCPLVEPDAPRPLDAPPAEGGPEPFRAIDRAYVDALPEDQRASFMRNAVVADARTHRRFLDELAPGFAQADLPFVEALHGHLPYGPRLRDLVASTELGCPALVVAGRQDRLVGYRAAFDALATLPRATFAVLDVAGHNLQIERPAPLDALVQDWLDRVEGHLA